MTDDIDTCFETPDGELVDVSGCADSQKDTDNDGVTDDKDLCPNTPDGIDVDSDGCSNFTSNFNNVYWRCDDPSNDCYAYLWFSDNNLNLSFEEENGSFTCFIIPLEGDDIASEYDVLRNELEAYNPELMHKDSLLVISKSDMLDDELKQELDVELKNDLKGIPYMYISSVAQMGLLELKDEIWKAIQDD